MSEVSRRRFVAAARATTLDASLAQAQPATAPRAEDFVNPLRIRGASRSPLRALALLPGSRS